MFGGSFPVCKAPSCVTLYHETPTLSHFKSSLGVFLSFISDIIGYLSQSNNHSLKEVQGFLGMDSVGQGATSGES